MRLASPHGYLIVKPKGGEEKRIDFDVPGRGFYFESDAVAEDLRNGRKEDAKIPLAESLRVMKLMDSIRMQNGLRYQQDG